MKSLYSHISILAIIMFMMGCGHISPKGAFYTHITTPLDVNLSQTPQETARGDGAIKHFSYRVHVMWDSNAIGDIAKRNGLETIYFADLETLRVLSGYGACTQSTSMAGSLAKNIKYLKHNVINLREYSICSSDIYLIGLT